MKTYIRLTWMSGIMVNLPKSCHQTEAWSIVTFDHGSTGWALEGKHASIGCAKCHFEEKSGQRVQKFRVGD